MNPPKKSKQNGHFYTKCRQEMEELDREYEAAQERHRRAEFGTFSLVPLPEIDLEPVPSASTASTGVQSDQFMDHGQDECIFYNTLTNIPNTNNNNNIDTAHEDIDSDGDGCADFEDDAVGWDDAFDIFDDMSLIDCLRYLAVSHQLPRSTVNMMLAILRKKLNLNLPKDARTLVKTPTGVGKKIIPIPGGDFWYGGLKPVLTQHLQNVNPEVTPFSLDVSIDGLPLHNAGPTQLWPILVRVVELPKLPVMTVATFCGPSKPASITPFLEPLVDELNLIQREGLAIGDKIFHFKIRAFIADSPARAFIKATTSYVGYHGCLKCSVIGEYDDFGKKIIFNTVDAPLRTDEGFRNRVCPDHHKSWRTPLEKLDNFHMINGVVSCDRLHLIDLGGTRRHLKSMVGGKYPGVCAKWSIQTKETVSQFLMSIDLPSEVHRRIRHLKYLAFWKGTEYRTFLHYTSVVVMKDFLRSEVYGHFLLYFCGVTIFSSSAHQRLWPRAEEFLRLFVKDFAKYYGQTHMTSNIHNLQHVSGEVALYGPLDGFSAYAFENHLQLMKRWVRAGTKCAQQVAARSDELARVYRADNENAPQYPILKANGVGLHVTADFVLMPNFKDQWFLTKDNGIVKFLSAKKSSQSIAVVGVRFVSVSELFSVPADENILLPFSSAEIHAYKVHEHAPSLMVEVPWTEIRLLLGILNQTGGSTGKVNLREVTSGISIAIPVLCAQGGGNVDDPFNRIGTSMA
uniref:Transposase domain-containing protein n=1 Tax=Anopheles minimus TaxID=112268 RepID=A0A182W8C9_9DIPT